MSEPKQYNITYILYQCMLYVEEGEWDYCTSKTQQNFLEPACWLLVVVTHVGVVALSCSWILWACCLLRRQQGPGPPQTPKKWSAGPCQSNKAAEKVAHSCPRSQAFNNFNDTCTCTFVCAVDMHHFNNKNKLFC